MNSLDDKLKTNTVKLTKPNRAYRFTYEGNKKVNKIMKFIYNDAHVKLDRKYEIFKKAF